MGGMVVRSSTTPMVPPRPPRWRRSMRGPASGHRPALLGGSRGGLLPPQPLAPRWPPRWRRGMREPASGCPPPPPLAGVIGGLLPPPTRWLSPPPQHGSPRLARLGAWRCAGLGASGPRAEEGRVPRTLGGAAHQRVAGGSDPGRAWEAGRARPSQEDNAAGPARRASGTSTWRPGTTRGGAMGQLGPPEEPVWPSWPARQQRLMPQPGLLHRAQDGAPCCKQSQPCVPLPAPGGRLRYGAASGTLRTGARGGRRAYGSRGGPPSRGREK